MNIRTSENKKKNKFLKKMWDSRYMYMLIIPAIIFYIVFNYAPMYGIKIAFQDFYPRLGVKDSPWIGLENFKIVFAEPLFWRAFRNTLTISFSKVISGFVFAVMNALLINELRLRKFSKIAQTVITFPHFLSWVSIAGFTSNLFTNSGDINTLIAHLGGTKIDFLSDKGFFFSLLILTEVWKEAGWGSIIYLAAIAGIDAQLYEASELDGAGRIRKIFSITLPCIKSTIILMLILSVGNVMDGGFDQIFNMYNPLVYEVSDTLDTYIYRITFGTSSATNPGISAAIGLFKSIISCALVLTVDRIAKMTGERGII